MTHVNPRIGAFVDFGAVTAGLVPLANFPGFTAKERARALDPSNPSVHLSGSVGSVPPKTGGNAGGSTWARKKGPLSSALLANLFGVPQFRWVVSRKTPTRSSSRQVRIRVPFLF